MRQALARAREFEGATAPNPPVGAAALSAEGTLLCVGAHERAGTYHAEARVIEELHARKLPPAHTLVVTLEPCNHTGRTPPCTDAILALAREGSLKRVVYGSLDLNPRVKGVGLARLQAAGLEVSQIDDPALRAECDRLVAPFVKWITTGRPWVTIKSAWNRDGTMLPPPGQQTFTTDASLTLAHRLRKRSDAILTGSGTVLADHPKFTVRRVQDHPGKTRWLVVLDRSKRTPPDWVKHSEDNGFSVRVAGTSLSETLDFLGHEGVLEVLVEAGPTLTHSFLSTSLWDEHVLITQAKTLGDPDRVEIVLRAV